MFLAGNSCLVDAELHYVMYLPSCTNATGMPRAISLKLHPCSHQHMSPLAILSMQCYETTHVIPAQAGIDKDERNLKG
jgi:hypothetical protein